MVKEKIYFDPNDKRVFLDVYAVNDATVAPRDALLVIPGGGYSGVSYREGIYTALAFLGRGVNAFVLTYSVEEDAVYPRQLLDAARAMQYIKENAEKYHVDPERIFATGFSAGGHLLGTLTALHGVAEELLGLPKDYLKIRGAIFCYPVISALLENTHRESFENLLKKPFSEYTAEEKALLSIENNVTPDTPPAFIWHTSQDDLVPIDGSLALCKAYNRVGTPVELHIYPYGPHGIAVATEYSSNGRADYIQPKAEVWVDEAVKWMKGI